MRVVILGMLLGYYWTGLEMVLYHHASLPMDRPAYVHGPRYKKFFVGLLWPYVSRRNEELGFFVSLFFSSFAVAFLSLLLLTKFIGVFWSVLLIGVVRTYPIPKISSLYTGAASLLSGMIFSVLAKIFGLRLPGAIERLEKWGKWGSSARI